MRQLRLIVGLMIVAAGLQVGAGAPTQAQQLDIDTGASAVEIAQVIAADPSTVTGAAWVARPPGGTPTALATGFLAGFPRDGSSYGILTSGNAALADDPNTSPSSGANNGGLPVRGDTDYDVTVLRIDLTVPAGVNCLVGIEFRFLSDEYPEFVGTQYNDAFILELDTSTWTTSGSTITAPDNFAFDPTGNVISINSAGVTSMTAAEAADTTYDGATPALTAATPIDPGPRSIFLSIFDQGDPVYDSAVFVDNLRFGTVADVANDCRPGAQVVDRQRPLPLLGAHGITGVAEDMQPNLDFAESVVDGLPGVLSTVTAPVGSVWDNAVTLATDTFTLLDTHDSGAVNVIAHSKGGLDARVAMWALPDWFEDLAMLATPNGGSGLANTLCMARRLGQNWLFAEMGACDDDSDGLYNLQTGYIADVYNFVVKDSPQHDFWIAAGDCMGVAFTEEGRVSCNATGLVGHDCTDVDGFLGLGDPDGENAVCVWSAFAQVNGFDPGGSHFAIDPVFEGLDHTDMREDACPNTAVLAWMYGPFYPDNPWIVGDGAGCKDLPRIEAGFAASDTAALVPIPSASLQSEPDTDFGPVQMQSIAEIVLDGDGRAAVPVSDEGHGFGVLVLAAAGDFSALELHGPGGQVVAPTAAHEVDLFDTPGSFGAMFPSVGEGTLVVVGEPNATVGLSVSVVSEVTADAETTVLPDGQVEITATLAGASPSVANDTVVTAFVGDGHTTPIDVPLAQVNGAVLTFRTVITPEKGGYQPVDVFIAGPHTRLISTGFIIADGTGSIDALESDQLVDTDGDGVVDALELSIAVSSEVAGLHELSLELEVDGVVVGNGPGQADLAVGENIMTVTIGLDEMASVGLAGPYEVVDLLLTRGPRRVWVAQRDSLGPTSVVPLDALGAGDLELSRPSATAADTNLDGRLDTLTWSWVTWAPEAGPYEFDGALLGPNGRQLATLALVTELAEGPNVVSYQMDGSLIGGHLAGRYALIDLTGTLETDASVFDRAPAGFSDVLDPSAWVEGTPSIGTLIELWQMAYADGGIFTNGLYQSELNRLTRAEQDIRSGRTDDAIDELEHFVDHIVSRSGKSISPETVAQLTGYASALIDVLME